MKKVTIIIATIILFEVNIFGQGAGNAIEFDGIDDYIMVPHHSSLNPEGESWTISLWIRPPDTLRRSPVIIKRLPASGYDQYSLGIADTSSHNPSPGKRLYINYIDSAGVSERSGYALNEFVDGDWHYINFVADKSIDSILFYVDGIKQDIVIEFNPGPWPDVDNLNPLYIAHNNSSAFYKGQIDELSIWSKALTTEQINLIMWDTIGSAYYSTSDSGLVGYWRFDLYEDLGIGGDGADDVRDYSVFANHGDTYGNPSQIISTIPAGIEDQEFSDQQAIVLLQNYPNPFNDCTTIKYQISDATMVSIKVFDIIGKEIASLVNEKKLPGLHTVKFDLNRYKKGELKSGIYFIRLNAGSEVQLRKIGLTR